MDDSTAHIADLVRKLLVVPDKLMAAQLSLRPLTHADPNAAQLETGQTIADACDLMHSALADVVEVARDLTQLTATDLGGATFRRVRVESYYQQVP